MDRNDGFQQQFSPKRNGKQLQSLPQGYINQSENNDEEKVVKELGKLLAAGRRRAIVILLAMIAANSALFFLLAKRSPTYEGKFQLLVEPLTTAENRLLSAVTQTLGVTNPKTDSGLDYESQIRVLKSPILMSKLIKILQDKYPNLNYEDLLGQMTIERIMKENEGTKILEVTYKDKDPEKVQFVLDRLSETYLEYSLQERQSYLSQGIGFIANQIPAMQRQVDTLGKRLQTLRQQYNLVDPAIQDRYLTEQANAIVQQRLDNQMRLAQSRVQYTTLQKLFDEGNITAVLSQDSTSYTFLIRQINEISSQISETSTRFREESKNMRILRQQEQDLNQRAIREAQNILQKAKSEVRGWENRQEIIVQAENKLRERISQLPAITRETNDLQAQLQVATDTLNQLIAKRDKLRIEAVQQEVPWQLIAPPELPRDREGRPIKTKINKKTLLVFMILTLVFGLGVGFLVEILHNVFHTSEDLEEETKLPILAVIPFAKEVKRLLKKPHPLVPVAALVGLTERASRYFVINKTVNSQGYIHSPFLESFRYFYTNIRLISPDKPIQSLVISSATPKDGKSTIAINLAKTAAAIGQRVLLVDADLRRPKIHKKLDLPNLRGLSEIISADISLNEVIQRSHSEENLFVLTAGATPPDPIKHLSSEKMRHLMEQFQAFFDLVIYDTPPLLGLADANLLAAYTDGLVLVVGLEKTDRFMVLKALDGLNIAGSTVLGIVANGVKGFKPKVYKAYQRV